MAHSSCQHPQSQHYRCYEVCTCLFHLASVWDISVNWCNSFLNLRILSIDLHHLPGQCNSRLLPALQRALHFPYHVTNPCLPKCFVWVTQDSCSSTNLIAPVGTGRYRILSVFMEKQYLFLYQKNFQDTMKNLHTQKLVCFFQLYQLI